jgi:hypothetical protein
MAPMLNYTGNPPQNILRQIIGVDTMYIQYCYKEYVIVIEFLDVCVFAPGGTHDATHMRSSEFFKKLMRRRLLQESNINIEGKTIKPYISGDSAYFLLKHIQKPFNAKLFGHDDQDAFDKYIRQGMVKIEKPKC